MVELIVMKVLLIEDDEEIAAFIKWGLLEQGLSIGYATTSRGGLHKIRYRLDILKTPSLYVGIFTETPNIISQ